jgi:predicted nuclease with TOPRIM domain
MSPPAEFPLPTDFTAVADHRETTGERLVRIETLMQTVLNSLHIHIRDEEKDLKEFKDALKMHMEENGRLNVDVRELSRDIREMKAKLSELEKEVQALSRTRLSVIAWAGGVSATISALWIMAGDKITKLFGG